MISPRIQYLYSALRVLFI